MFPPPETERSRAVVLVHGAWVGEWSWLPVLPILAASGRPVYPVSLTGHGTRRHQGGPHVTLDHHVDDLCGVVETYDLSDITLVGHSYGGRVISRAFERLAHRLSSMVYLDAHAPVAPDSGQTPEREALAEANGGMLPFAGYDPDPSWIEGREAVEWFLARIAAQSFACLTAQWQVELPTDLPKTYVYATGGGEASRFTRYAEAVRQADDWRYREVPGPHFLMFSHPDQVAEIILEA